MNIFKTIKKLANDIAKPVVMAAGLFAGIAMLGNEAQAQEKQKAGRNVTKDVIKDGKVIGTESWVETVGADGKSFRSNYKYSTREKTIVEKVTTKAGVKTKGPQNSDPNWWSNYLKNETPAQRAKRKAREARENNAPPVVVGKETIITIKEVDKAESKAVDSVTTPAPAPTPVAPPIVSTPAPTPPVPEEKGQWIVDLSGQATTDLGDGSIYNGEVVPGVSVGVQTPQFSKKGVGKWVNASGRVSANSKPMVSSVVRNQDCGCVGFIDFNSNSGKPQFDAKMGLNFGPMLSFGSFNLNPVVSFGAGAQTRDDMLVTKGKELTPQAKKMQSIMYGYVSAGATMVLDLGGNKKTGLAVIGNVNVEKNTLGKTHTNPYNENVNLGGNLKAQGRLGLAMRF